MVMGDVSEGAAVITQSPYIGQEDNRRAAEGFLVGMQNADVIGMTAQVNAFRSARYNQQRMTETYFIAYLLYIDELYIRISDPDGDAAIRGTVVHMQICDVLVGYPEHAIEGQEVTMYILRNIENYRNAVQYMQVGQRYLVRGAYVREYPRGARGRFMPDRRHGPLLPTIGNSANTIMMWPLCEEGTTEDQVWFHPIATGQQVDFTLPYLSHIPAEMEMLRRDQSSVQLQGTADMTVMPETDRAIRLHQGRLINHNDYLTANPVAVIDRTFARARGLELGSTISVTIPRHQHFVGQVGLRSFMTPLIRMDRNYQERFYDAHTVELEIVGITVFEELTRYTAQSLFVFVPNSVLPQDIGVYWRRWGWGDTYDEYGQSVQGRVELPVIQLGQDYVPDVWYSFVLADSRYEDDFYQGHRWQIYDLGMDLVTYFVDSSNFWLSAAPILLTITFNLVLFLIVFILVMGLVAFLYLRQKRREIAIMRAIGRSTKRIMWQIVITAILFGIPPIALGGVAAWHFALNEATNTLVLFEEAYEEAIPLTGYELRWQEMFGDRPMLDGREVGLDIDLNVQLGMYWLAALLAIVLALMILMVAFGGIRILRLPVLMQLQGAVSAPGKVKDTSSSETTAPSPSTDMYLPRQELSRSAKDRVFSSLRWIRRHITRSPVKSVLGLAVTLFFIITLGWLQESIDRTAAEVDRIYETTIIRGEIAQNHAAAHSGNYIGDNIRHVTVQRFLNTGYIYSAFMEAGFEETFVLPLRDGTMPEFWRSLIGYFHAASVRWNRYMHSQIAPFDHALGINDIEMFLQAHNVAATGRVFDDTHDFEMLDYAQGARAGGLRNIEIDFAPGFCADTFNIASYTPGDIVPIIVSSHTLERRGLTLGDYAAMGYNSLGLRRQDGRRSWSHIYVVIAGVHNRQIHHANMQDAVLMPLMVLEHYVWQVRYISMDFAINPAYNREIGQIRETFELILNPTLVPDELGMQQLSLFVYDRELNSIINSLEQSMLLLEMLYPVAVGIALIIGAGIALIIVLQGTKNAAIMRVLGASKLKAGFITWAEQVLLCLLGLCIGVVALILMGRGIDMVLMLSGMYLAGVAFGSAVGAVVITAKKPIEHLQVRE